MAVKLQAKRPGANKLANTTSSISLIAVEDPPSKRKRKRKRKRPLGLNMCLASPLRRKSVWPWITLHTPRAMCQ
ncbi:hypothetical protein TRIATDRAFT_299838 [Trichoderma atroviride IMI 206040]|uniref:Uncharacterized protein n=1 Tax=Hypocrea atroviridis (strain ATCC 20476 / IMI 206040) TaxID=452589 RepID=G9NVU6_HYPAI|nr:uncharacterized protein TRIATDRAFT_299838 [Trichoderma atroviride IMI 206040]EHK45114.1 hypothetical protein TRIATDRAFT_299838 [Trichoderma atroviride IMI 206040]